jgi:hypothetical protein
LAGPPKESGGRTEARTREKKELVTLLLLFSSVFSSFFSFFRAHPLQGVSPKRPRMLDRKADTNNVGTQARLWKAQGKATNVDK